jgi:hypothetical protein
MKQAGNLAYLSFLNIDATCSSEESFAFHLTTRLYPPLQAGSFEVLVVTVVGA